MHTIQNREGGVADVGQWVLNSVTGYVQFTAIFERLPLRDAICLCNLLNGGDGNMSLLAMTLDKLREAAR